MKSVYVINYKETNVNENGIMSVESGVVIDGFRKKDDAIRECINRAQGRLNSLESGHIFIEDMGARNTITDAEDTYEYWVSKISVR